MAASFMETVADVASQIATGIWGDGAAKALKFNIDDVARSRVNKLERSALDSLIGKMSANGVEFNEDALKTIKDAMPDLDMNRADLVNYLTHPNVITNSDKIDLSQDAIQNAINNYKEGNKKLTKYIEAGKTTNAASEYLGKEKGQIGIWNMATGYFGDIENGGTRIKTAIAAASGTGLATRFLSGGNLTTTASGERDIAGVPFF